ncbi:MAG: imidazolonepropionase-like amidohydrolase [Bacteroidia bacterium]|jgi:imidazolonepropionase-like amidohydrolase
MRSMLRIFPLFLLLIAVLSSSAQVPTPGATPKEQVVLVGGNLHVGNGQVIANAAIGMKDGVITFVKDANEVNDNSGQIIEISGMEVYPGFILPNNVLGIFEVAAVRATRDFSEVGGFNPNVRSIIAFNTESKVTTTVRSNGVLMSQVTPRSGRISGTSSIVHLDGWNWEDAAVLEDDGIHLNWPVRNKKSGWWAEPGPTKANDKYNEEVDELKQFLQRAKAYSEKPDSDVNLKMESCRGLFDGEKRFYIHVNNAKEITQAVLMANSLGINHPVIVGGADSWMITDFLNQHKIPVILERVHSMPDHEDSDVDQPYKTPKMLFDAGIEFCFNYQGDKEAMGARNLPFSAGTAVAYGLPYEEAIKALTSKSATIMGCGDICGTVEKGKQATLFVSKGDALDMRTNDVVHAFIQGRKVDLDNHQKKLYRKYMAKYEQD